MPALNFKLTDAGRAAAIAANGAGLQLQITHAVLGSGQYTPLANRTALQTRREKVTIAGGYVQPGGAFRVGVIFPGWTLTPYNACEMGFYAGDPDAGGILVAVYSHPSDVMFVRNSLSYVSSFILQLAEFAGTITITVDPSASQAIALMASHNSDVNPHPQYLLQAARTGELSLVTGNKAIPGTLKANGALLSRVTYSRLWAWAQDNNNVAASEAAWLSSQASYSPGDGSTTFRLPNVRGGFLRCWDDGAGVDAGRAIGSFQAGQNLWHVHETYDPGHAHANYDPGHDHGVGTSAGNNDASGVGPSPQSGSTYRTAVSSTGISIYSATTGISIGGSGGSEARPNNYALLACIWY